MLLKQHTEIIINATPEGIWEFAYNPENWTMSNPEEHRGLVFFNKMNRPETGIEFHQKELVAGFYADLKGQILYAERPPVCVWSGTAIYRVLGGLLKPRIPEGGVVQVKRVDKGCKVAHDVYMDFPDSIFGKMLLWVFKKFFNGEKAVYDHTYRELVYFKEK
jgi:hypothetical protein